MCWEGLGKKMIERQKNKAEPFDSAIFYFELLYFF